MAAEIIGVDKGSPAERAGIRMGDILLSVNGHRVRDVLDYRFYAYDPRLSLMVDRGGEKLTANIHKGEGEELGLNFETYLIDDQKNCSNRCVFCFVDQLPRGMRSTLYVKDDDARLSFLMGNYISLTNLSEEDVDRMIRMRLMPINVSVHATNPALRTLMLGNKRGGESLDYLYRFAEAGLSLNTQIVVCPGLNDGAELERSLRELSALYPSVQSVAVVPVGLSRHRDGLYPLTPVSRDNARDILRIIDERRAKNLEEHGTALCQAADELFLKAGLPVPGEEYYEGYPQLENGVGMMRSMQEELVWALEQYPVLPAPAPFTVATGKAAETFIREMIDLVGQKCDNLECLVQGVENRFFGEMVDVAGLLTGGDVIAALSGRLTGDRLLIPRNMLKQDERLFLDGVSLEQMEGELGCRVQVVELSGEAFLDAILSE